MKKFTNKNTEIKFSTNQIDLNQILAKSLGFSILIYCAVLYIQFSDIHNETQLPGSTIYSKAPYILLIIGIVLQATRIISSTKIGISLSYLALPFFILWIKDLDTDILVFGHQDKAVIYKTALYTYLIPLTFVVTYITIRKNSFSNAFIRFKKILKLKLVLPIVIIVPAIYISSFFIIDERHPYMLNSINFMIVIHSVVQSTFGKYVFFDQVSQYGGYSIILRPIWEIFDYSVKNVTILFAILNLGVMIAVGYVTLKLINSKFIAILSYLTFIYFHYFAFIVWPFEKYYQYDPIRTVFPAVFLIFFYLIKNLHIKVLTLATIAGVSLIWNIETGLCVILAFLFWIFVTLDRKLALKYSVLFIFTSFSTIFVIFSIVSLFTLEAFKLDFVFRMLNLYGVTGPMEDLAFGKFWVFVILIYGLAVAVAQRIRQHNTRIDGLSNFKHGDRESAIIFIAILATCLISYHLLRLGQHDATLGNSAYFFPLLSGYLVDVLLQNQTSVAIKIKNIKSLYFVVLRNVLVITLSIMFILSSISLFMIQRGDVVGNEERFWNFTEKNNSELYDYVDDSGETYMVTIKDRINGQLSPYELRVNFARKYTQPIIQEDLLVLSPFDSMLYFHLNAKSPVSWANWWHAWVEDFSEVKQKIENKNIKRIIVERYPGINTEPFSFHPYEFDRYIDEILIKNFELVDSEVVTKIWLGQEWSNVTLSMYKIR